MKPANIVLTGVALLATGYGVAKAAMNPGQFSPSPQQQEITRMTEVDALRQAEKSIADRIYDDGCEPVFFLDSFTNKFKPLGIGQPVTSGYYYQRIHANKGSAPPPQLSDYVPEGVTVCDAYGTAGVMVDHDSKPDTPAIVKRLGSTSDRERIRKVVDRFSKAKRPQLAAPGVY